MSTEVEALRARLQAYEHREAQWKQHLEKAQLEHTQLQTYQQKLTQAGTHLKALATDNNRLQQELNQRTASLEQLEQQLQKDHEDWALQLEQQKKSNYSTLEFLLQQLHLDDDQQDNGITQTSPASALPDISNLEQVQHYIETVTANTNSKVKEKDTTINALKMEVEQLQSRLEEMEQLVDNPPSEQQPPTSPSTTSTGDHISIESVDQNIKGIINDTENFMVNSSSLPPQLMVTLEYLRDHLQTLADQQKTARQQDGDEIKDLKRQITRLNMAINEWSEQKEQWLSEKEELEIRWETANSSTDLEEKLTLVTTERQTFKDNMERLEQERQSLSAKIADYETRLSSTTTEHQDKVLQLNKERQTLLDKLDKLEEKLRSSETARQQADDQVKQLQQEHHALLDKIAHIKETLAPRLEADKQLRVKVAELTEELEQTKQQYEEMRSTLVSRDEEAGHQLENKERHLNQLQMRLEKVQQEREELEMAVMELDTRCHQLVDLNTSLSTKLALCEKQIADQKQSSAAERASLENLESVLEEFQTIKDAEIRAAVEHIERQLEVAKKSWMEYQERARLAESSLEQYQHDVAKTPQYEREIKEKNLLIGKLRHEAIILNEHLVEAMRRLKEESNESNVDRQLITNLVIGFLMAPRGDRKRYDILSIIANVLQMTDEQKEQVGLIRMKNNGQRGNASPTLAGWQSPRQQQENEPKESFTDAWISFLLKESSKRKPSVSSSPKSDQLDI
ncbi:hypothetical protein BC941DRAFT_9703 [Chlamydoabsidia padenii]|nr:hypothetical protein BC941DRAFT_9703 [Chlamydoabsidia padenii]